tara:strand:- start:77 stop:367 length:291 start_codon:yes stop_codon:yes gene_type:complete
MESNILQIQNITVNEFVLLIESVIENKLSTLQESKKPENLTVKEAAQLLKVSEQSIHNYIKKGFISAQKVGRILLIKRTDIEQSLNEVKSLRYKRS